MVVDAVIMPGTRRAYLVVKLRTMEKGLTHLQEVRLALHFEAELLANRIDPPSQPTMYRARTTIVSPFLSDLCCNPVRVFSAGQQFMAKLHRYIWNPVHSGF